MKRLRHALAGLLCILLTFSFAPNAWAFCGFFVSGADVRLSNHTSQVAIARNGEHTVLTMANDYQGDVADFALVVPVPTVIQPDQVTVVDPMLLDRLNTYTAPRLVDYPFTMESSNDPCFENPLGDALGYGLIPGPPSGQLQPALGVVVEASFTVGEYDIVILNAQESSGLETWLTQHNYRIPAGSSEVLNAYIRQGMNFFVAKVNLDEFDRSDFQSLRPLQITYDSPRFMLPIRLGMVNAQGSQDLVIYFLVPDGRVETTNYRTLEIPSNFEVPGFVEHEFSDFYHQLFQKAEMTANHNATFVEYAWDPFGRLPCDPCTAVPLDIPVAEQLGVNWGDQRLPATFITRMHVRYDREHFPEDLVFQATKNHQRFQGRYVIHRYHPLDESKSTPSQCTQAFLNSLRFDWANAHERGNTQADFSGYLSERLLAFADSYHGDGSRSIRFDGYPYPTWQDTDDPVEYIGRFIRAVYLRYYHEQLAQLEESAQNYADITGADIDQVRRRISATTSFIPNSWLRKYPPAELSNFTGGHE